MKNRHWEFEIRRGREVTRLVYRKKQIEEEAGN